MRLPCLLVTCSLALGGLAGCVTFDDSATPDMPAATDIRSATIARRAPLPAPAPSLWGDSYTTVDGAVLPLRAWLPEGAPEAVVLALHGFNNYSDAFTLPAPHLVAHGIAVYAYDQRGFGKAPGRGRWAGTATMAEDAAQAASLLRRRYPGRPLYLLGESMGGAVAIVAATQASPAPVDGVILAAPAVWGRQTMNVFERTGLWLAGLVPSMRVSRHTLPITIAASDNTAVLRAIAADPLVIKETRTDTLNGLVDLMDAALAAAPRLDLPALILYGEHDEIVPRAPVERLVETLPAATPHRIAVYASGYHLLLRDLHANIVLDDVAAWLHDRRVALPSNADRAGLKVFHVGEASLPSG